MAEYGIFDESYHIIRPKYRGIKKKKTKWTMKYYENISRNI